MAPELVSDPDHVTEKVTNAPEFFYTWRTRFIKEMFWQVMYFCRKFNSLFSGLCNVSFCHALESVHSAV